MVSLPFFQRAFNRILPSLQRIDAKTFRAESSSVVVAVLTNLQSNLSDTVHLAGCQVLYSFKDREYWNHEIKVGKLAKKVPRGTLIFSHLRLIARYRA